MLILNGSTFTTGRTRFMEATANKREASAKVYIPIRVGGVELLAQLLKIGLDPGQHANYFYFGPAEI